MFHEPWNTKCPECHEMLLVPDGLHLCMDWKDMSMQTNSRETGKRMIVTRINHLHQQRRGCHHHLHHGHHVHLCHGHCRDPARSRQTLCCRHSIMCQMLLLCGRVTCLEVPENMRELGKERKESRKTKTKTIECRVCSIDGLK